MSIDTEHRLPRHLIARAVTEHEAHGMILLDTAALLVEAGGTSGGFGEAGVSTVNNDGAGVMAERFYDRHFDGQLGERLHLVGVPLHPHQLHHR
jgi:hypothetical protein